MLSLGRGLLLFRVLTCFLIVDQVQPVSFREQVEFLDWLKERGQEDACQSTTVGISAHGR